MGIEKDTLKFIMEDSDKKFEKWMVQLSDDVAERPKHKVLTIELIDTIKDEDLVLAIMDNMWLKIKEDMSNDLEIISSLSKERQALYVVNFLEAEVSNGGFTQYYYNSHWQFSEMAVDGFELMGSENFANLMRKANTTYLHEKGIISENHDGTLEGFCASYEKNPLNKYNDEFYDLNEVESLENLQKSFIRANKASFIDL